MPILANWSPLPCSMRLTEYCTEPRVLSRHFYWVLRIWLWELNWSSSCQLLFSESDYTLWLLALVPSTSFPPQSIWLASSLMLWIAVYWIFFYSFFGVQWAIMFWLRIFIILFQVVPGNNHISDRSWHETERITSRRGWPQEWTWSEEGHGWKNCEGLGFIAQHCHLLVP